jgi:hypothetical protein
MSTDQTSQSGAPLTDATTPTSPDEVLREWKNPTAREVVFTLHTSRRRVHVSPATGATFEVDQNAPHEIHVAPGATVKLLSRWDHAVQILACQDPSCEGRRCKSPTTHRGVVVMGGLAPQLVRLDLPRATVHPGLLAAPRGPTRTAAVEDDMLAAARRRKGAR